MHRNAKKIQKLFLCLNYGNLAEFLEILHELEGCLAGAGASGFVTLNYLSLSIGLEGFDVSVDSFYKCFHKKNVLKSFSIKCQNSFAIYKIKMK